MVKLTIQLLGVASTKLQGQIGFADIKLDAFSDGAYQLKTSYVEDYLRQIVN